MRVLVDMDGVVADFSRGFLMKWRELHPNKFVPIEQRTTFYIVSDTLPEEFKPLISAIYTAPNFFRTLEPILGSIEALHEMHALGIEVFLCTSPLAEYEHCVLEKYQWVEQHLGREWTKRLILTKDKTIVRADILIDDRPHVKGVDTPIWEHVLYDQPYNRSQTHKRRVTWQSWKRVLLPTV